MTRDSDDVEEGKLNNGNAVKHGLFSDRNKMFKRLEDEEKRFVVELSKDLLERLDGQAGKYEREAIRNISMDVLKRRRANAHFADEENFDLTQGKTHSVYSRIIRDTTDEMEKLGLHVQNPEQEKAEAQAGWFDALSEAEEDE